VKTFLPEDGEVRLLKITDKQFERMKVFNGKTLKATEKAPEQLSFF
jgi:CRISPR-associated protein Cas2